MKQELPQITTNMYTTGTYTADNTGQWVQSPIGSYHAVVPQQDFNWQTQIETLIDQQDQTHKSKKPKTAKKEKVMSDTRRLVKVFIVDPDENVPLDKCIIHNGEEHLTESTDEELFFEIPVKELLDKHNEKRVKFKKEKSGKKSEYLKPARIRDLKMVVVTIASF